MSTRAERTAELKDLVARKWSELPESLRTPTQLAGVGGVACGATHGVLERCNFACTSCYLTEFANAVPPLPFEEVRRQLDTMRTHLGPGGKAQITSGEVTLLPLEDLGRIVAYAREIGLDPMVMTNGERFLDEPEYLHELVKSYGLRKVSIHIDTTQRGRKALREGMSERDLHPLRDRFAALIRSTRQLTRARLHAAQTVTVNATNLDGVADITEWALRNADAFRMISFQPVAAVGRTQDDSPDHVSMETVWERVCRAAGRPLNERAMVFGHPRCNVTVPLAILSSGDKRRIFEPIRAGSTGDQTLYGGLLRTLSTAVDTDDGLGATIAHGALPLLRGPGLLARGLAYAVRRAWSDRRTLGFATARLLTLRKVRVHPQIFVVHSFMNSDELDTPLGRERLDACVFRVPVDGEMVPMCEFNALGQRRAANRAAQVTGAATIPASVDDNAPVGARG